MDGKTKAWVEIDNAGQIEPSWDAFELFNNIFAPRHDLLQIFVQILFDKICNGTLL